MSKTCIFCYRTNSYICGYGEHCGCCADGDSEMFERGANGNKEADYKPSR